MPHIWAPRNAILSIATKLTNTGFTSTRDLKETPSNERHESIDYFDSFSVVNKIQDLKITISIKTLYFSWNTGKPNLPATLLSYGCSTLMYKYSCIAQIFKCGCFAQKFFVLLIDTQLHCPCIMFISKPSLITWYKLSI